MWGIPAHLFNDDLFNQVGVSCGKIIMKSEVSNLNINMSLEWVAILTILGRKLIR